MHETWSEMGVVDMREKLPFPAGEMCQVEGMGRRSQRARMEEVRAAWRAERQV